LYYVCDDCFKEKFFQCKACKKTFYKEDYGVDKGYCSQCSPIDLEYYFDENYEEELFSELKFFVNGKKFNKKDVKTKLKKEVFVGVEIESEIDENLSGIKLQQFINKILSVVKDKGDFINDGSLECGIEVRSYPTTFNDIKTGKSLWDDFFRMVGRNKKLFVPSYLGNEAGMHVHVSKNAMKKSSVIATVEFFFDNKRFIEQIAERRENEYCRYVPYNIKSHYCAISESMKHDTWEFRIFNSVLNKDSFYKNIEFVQSIIDFWNREGVTDITKEGYFCFINKKYRTYPHLHKFLKTKGIETKAKARKIKSLALV
jgi:hypothetical protein